MTHLCDELPEFRKYDCSTHKNKVDPLGESVEEFLARGGQITIIPPGISSDVPIIPNKQPDGTYNNDYMAQEKSRRRTCQKNNAGLQHFVANKKMLGPSGHMYIRMTVKGEDQYYRCLIHGIVYSSWDKDIQVALKARNEVLIKRGETIPD